VSEISLVLYQTIGSVPISNDTSSKAARGWDFKYCNEVFCIAVARSEVVLMIVAKIGSKRI